MKARNSQGIHAKITNKDTLAILVVKTWTVWRTRWDSIKNTRHDFPFYFVFSVAIINDYLVELATGRGRRCWCQVQTRVGDGYDWEREEGVPRLEIRKGTHWPWTSSAAQRFGRGMEKGVGPPQSASGGYPASTRLKTPGAEQTPRWAMTCRAAL
jgi:hypothetical protein